MKFSQSPHYQPFSRGVALFLFVFAIFSALSWAIIIPSWEQPDESYHVSMLIHPNPPDIYYSVLQSFVNSDEKIYQAIDEEKSLPTNNYFSHFSNQFRYASHGSGFVAKTLIQLRLLNLALFGVFILIVIYAARPTWGIGYAPIVLTCLLPGVNALMGSVNRDWHGLVWAWTFLLLMKAPLLVRIAILTTSIVACHDQSFQMFQLAAFISLIPDFIKLRNYRGLRLLSLGIPLLLLVMVTILTKASPSTFLDAKYLAATFMPTPLLEKLALIQNTNLGLFDYIIAIVAVSISVIFTAGKQAFIGFGPEYLIFSTLGIWILATTFREQLFRRTNTYGGRYTFQMLLLLWTFFGLWTFSLLFINEKLKAGRFFFFVAPLLFALINESPKIRRQLGRLFSNGWILVSMLSLNFALLIYFI